MSLISGTTFIRDLGIRKDDKQLHMLLGQIWIPRSIKMKTEHFYKLIGSEYHIHEPELMSAVGLQVLLNSEVDVSKDTKKKDPNRIIHLLHTEQP